MRATSSVTSLPAPQIPLADHNCQGGLLMSCSVINGYVMSYSVMCGLYLKYFYALRCFAVAGGCGYSNPRPRSVMLLTAAPHGLNDLIWVAWPAGPPRWTRKRTPRPMWIQLLGSVNGMAQRTSRKLSLFLRPNKHFYIPLDLSSQLCYPPTPHFQFPNIRPDEVLSSSLRDESCPDLPTPVGRLW
jgi:hypothetical protein